MTRRVDRSTNRAPRGPILHAAPMVPFSDGRRGLELLREALGLPDGLTIEYSLSRLTHDDVPAIANAAGLLEMAGLGDRNQAEQLLRNAIESDPVVVTVVVNESRDEVERS